MAVVVVVGLVVAALSHRWLVPDYASDDGFSPLSIQTCIYDATHTPRSCATASNFEAATSITAQVPFARAPVSSTFPRVGVVLFGAITIAGAALAITVALAIARRRTRIPLAAITTFALVAAAAAAFLFYVKRPEASPNFGGPFDAGGTLWWFTASAGLGVVAARLVAPAIRTAS